MDAILKRKSGFRRVLWYMLQVCLTVQLVRAGPSINDSNTLLTDLLDGYNVNVRPVTDQDSSVNVSVTLHMASIQEFDEVLERLSFTGMLVQEWEDPRMVWDPSQYGGAAKVVVPYTSVWVPELVMSTAATSEVTISQSWNKARIQSTGLVKLACVDLIETKCAMNVKSFPFDTQNCVISLFPLGYSESEIQILPAMNKIGLSMHTLNPLWEVVGSEVATEVISTGEMRINFTVDLKRKSAFHVNVVILPVLLLAMLNALVFLLVPESGERIGFCITTLLAIAVYMTIIADMLPQSSDPVPLVCYKLMADMIISGMIVFVTVVNLRLVNKPEDEPVPKWVVSIYNCFKCKRIKGSQLESPEGSGNKVGVTRVKSAVNKSSADLKPRGTAFDEDRCSPDRNEPPTWQDVSRLIDWFSLAFFLCLSFFTFCVFILLVTVS